MTSPQMRADRDATWIEWHGGKCPVEGRVLVDVEHRDGDRYIGFRADDRMHTGFWDHDDRPGDIAFWRMSI